LRSKERKRCKEKPKRKVAKGTGVKAPINVAAKGRRERRTTCLRRTTANAPSPLLYSRKAQLPQRGGDCKPNAVGRNAGAGCRNRALLRNLRNLENHGRDEKKGKPSDAYRRLILQSLLTLLAKIRVSKRQRGSEREVEFDADIASPLLPRITVYGWQPPLGPAIQPYYHCLRAIILFGLSYFCSIMLRKCLFQFHVTNIC
jgi:hypothetical protein